MNMFIEIGWKDDAWEDDFKNYFTKYFNTEDEYLLIRKAYENYIGQYDEFFANVKPVHDRQKRRSAMENARNMISELFDSFPVNEEYNALILEYIDDCIEPYMTTPKTLKDIFELKAKRVLRSSEMSSHTIDKLIPDFKKFHK